PAARLRAGTLGGAATASLHRPGPCRRAGGPPDGRAGLGARPDRDAEDRGAHLRPETWLHDRDRHAQHAAGRPGLRVHRLFHAGPVGRARPDRQDLHEPGAEDHRGLHHRAVWLTQETISMKTISSPGGRTASAPPSKDGGAVKRIALIEDDADIAYTIRLNLRKEKRYQVEHYISGLAALAALQEKPFDLVILDLNLPDIDGLALCRELRRSDETRRVPIIMLTARVEERDKLLGFEIGADDYITKPFSMRELLARVHAQLRRAASLDSSDEEVFHDGALAVDRARFEARLNGERVHLTK